MKLNGTAKFVLVALGAIALTFGGMRAYTMVSLSGVTLDRIEPGRVSLVAVAPGKGYRIIVANRVAQLAEVTDGGDGRGGFGGQDTTNAENLKRIPIRELLGSLSKDPVAAGKLIERMNDLLPPDEPLSPFVWKEADIQKAIDGDPTLRKKLELDLQTTLDGKPVEEFSFSRITNGILVETMVPVMGENGQVAFTAPVRQRLQTRFASEVEKELNKRFNLPPDVMLSIYTTVAQRAKGDEGGKQEVVDALKARYSETRKKELALNPARLINSAFVVASDQHFSGAKATHYKDNRGNPKSDLAITMTDEGRKRLWKYSVDRKGFQLMLIVNGVAIAAPRITTELAEKTINIVALPDPPLATSAADEITKLGTKS